MGGEDRKHLNIYDYEADLFASMTTFHGIVIQISEIIDFIHSKICKIFFSYYTTLYTKFRIQRNFQVRIYSAEYWWARWFWIIVVFGSFSLFLYQVFVIDQLIDFQPINQVIDR